MKGSHVLIAGASVLVLLASAATAPAASRTSVQPTGLSAVVEVSHTGQLVMGGGVVLDRSTGSTTPALPPTMGSTSGFVRDNPVLSLQIASALNTETWVYSQKPVMLVNTATGAQWRVDTDSAGTPLAPAWSGTETDEPAPNDHPLIWVSPASVTRDGTTVAFCANYASPNLFTLHIKDLESGQLTTRPEACAAGYPESGAEGWQVYAPEVSWNGAVVHVRGAHFTEEPGHYFYPDTLVFPTSGKASRTLKGQGSMTRDGKLVFLRMGARAYGAADTTKGKVGAYKVTTKRTKRLPGSYTIYGTDALRFSAVDQSSFRGRYVVYGTRAAVIDRTTGKRTSITKVMAAHGYTPDAIEWWHARPYISGDGKWVFLRSGGQYVAVDWK